MGVHVKEKFWTETDKSIVINGDKLRQVRCARRLSQHQLARKARMDQARISRLESRGGFLNAVIFERLKGVLVEGDRE